MKRRTQYNLSHQTMTVGKIGALGVFDMVEIAPGDTFSGKVGMLLRFSPLKRAVLQDLHVDLFYFYVPHRLVWSDWEDFIADGPMDNPNHVPPSVSVPAGSETYEALFLKANSTTATTYLAFRTHAYNLIVNQFFRDQQDPVLPPANPPGPYGVDICYKKDYWTTIRDQIGVAQEEHFFRTNAGDGTEASAQDVLDAIARQKISMKRATYGTRYIDILRSYGININYQMLQRPECVGIGRSTINVTDVVSTADTGGGGATTELGGLGGHGIGGTRLRIKRKTFPEHGTLMGVFAVRPKFVDPGVTDWWAQPNRSYPNFYDPGLVPLPPVSVTKGQIKRSVDIDALNDPIGYLPWGHWYRNQGNLAHNRLGDGTWFGDADLPESGGPTFSPQNIREIDQLRFDNLFHDTTYGHFQVSAFCALRALRLIPRAQISTTTGMGG